MATVLCANCNRIVNELINLPEEHREPCLACGSKARVVDIHITDSGTAHDELRLKARHSSKEKPFLEAKTGEEFYRKGGKWVNRSYRVDRENDKYTEIILDKETNKIIHHCEEPLSQHKWHGSAKEQKNHSLSTEEILKILLASDLSFKAAPIPSGPHNTHPFAAKFPPELPRLFIETLTRPGEVVLDPMSGSGTTALEAISAGRIGIGVDMEPLATRLSAYKLKRFNLDLLRSGMGHVVNRAYVVERDSSFDHAAFLEKRYPKEILDFFHYWFREETLRQLAILIKEIDTIDDPDLRSFLEIIFSSTIIAKTGGVSLARDLAHSRPHRDETKKVKNAFALFWEKGQKAIVAQADKVTSGNGGVIRGDARALPLASESVDLIVTSPPYANAIDYVRAHKFSLYWLGAGFQEMAALRRRYIGAEVSLALEELPYPTAARSVGAVAEKDRKKAEVLFRYFRDMEGALREMARVLRPHKAAVVVVGSSTMRGIDVLTHEALAEIGQGVGLLFVGMKPREINRDRRLMPFSRKSSGTGIEARMHQEFVILFLKPGH